MSDDRRCIFGIDPGFGGGISYYIPELNHLTYMVMPTKIQYDENDIDSVAVEQLFTTLKTSFDIIVYIEEVHAIFGSSAASTFSFGYGYGKVVGIIESLHIPIGFVQPKKWQSMVWRSSDIIKKPDVLKPDGKIKKGKINTKESTINAVKRLYPNETFLATKKSKKIHDGITDSLAILQFGLIMEGIVKTF